MVWPGEFAAEEASPVVLVPAFKKMLNVALFVPEKVKNPPPSWKFVEPTPVVTLEKSPVPLMNPNEAEFPICSYSNTRLLEPAVNVTFPPASVAETVVPVTALAAPVALTIAKLPPFTAAANCAAVGAGTLPTFERSGFAGSGLSSLQPVRMQAPAASATVDLMRLLSFILSICFVVLLFTIRFAGFLSKLLFV